MRIHRFIGKFDLTKKEVTITDRALVHQLRSVLKIAPGERIILSNGDLHEALATVTHAAAEEVRATLEERYLNQNEPVRKVTLCAALIKQEYFELLVQKAVETGVYEIMPLHTARTVKLGFRRPRLERIIQEAAEQSGRGILPRLHDTISLGAAFTHASPRGALLFLDTEEKNEKTTPHISAPHTFIFVGPEGGWTPEERISAHEAHAYFVSLGPLVLRAETAATIATFLAIHEWHA